MPPPSHVERNFNYPAAALYVLVADVEAYPAYMPGWRAVRILHRTGNEAQVEQVVSLAGLRKQFVSIAYFNPPHRLVIQADGDLFKHFRLTWNFNEICTGITSVCAELELVFRSATMERLATHLMPDMLNPVVAALEHRAATHLIRSPPENKPESEANPSKYVAKSSSH
ncbi:MAG TPA: type II toxin-antitoxin system RatA family toxin [Acidocella sp.]|nr:MAG: hypothetical protein B7W99_00210 [Rhodospirillales bacterium 20-58-10]HQT37921.1 type II toxin-antitoxin system RatA family toxin [Acidocella sp.]